MVRLGTRYAISGSYPTAHNNLFAVGGSKPREVSMSTLSAMGKMVTAFVPQITITLSPRFAPGASVIGPLIFVVGGSDNGMASATKATEWMVY